MRVRRALLAAGALALTLAGAPAARADHAVRWGAGGDCATAVRSASTTLDTPVPFIVCVTLDGAPLAGHPLSVRVEGPVRRVELDVESDAEGIARFAVQPTAPGETAVTLCDDDGCVYGQTVIVVPGESTTTVLTTVTTAVSTAPPDSVADDGTDDDAGSAGGVPIGLVAGGVAVVGALAALGALGWSRTRRTAHVPVPAGLDGTLTREDLRALASLDPAILDAASTAARAAPAMTTEDQLDFFLADVYRRVDAAVHAQMDRVQLLGQGDIDATARLKALLESRAAVQDVRRRVAERLATGRRTGDG